jgi:hypothetical protein
MRSALLASCAVLGLATQAAALDLTGTWEFVKHGTCKGLMADGQRVLVKPKGSTYQDLPLSQSGDALRSYDANFLFVFGGRVYGQPGGDEGQGILQKCAGDPSVHVTYRILKAETFPETSKGVSGKMTTLYVLGNASQTYDCKIQWQRVSTADPGAAFDCP